MEISENLNGEYTTSAKMKVTNGSTPAEAPLVNGNKSTTCEWIRLNIGGQHFVTTKTTLCKNPHSFFYKLCQDDPSIGLTTDKVCLIFLQYT